MSRSHNPAGTRRTVSLARHPPIGSHVVSLLLSNVYRPTLGVFCLPVRIFKHHRLIPNPARVGRKQSGRCRVHITQPVRAGLRAWRAILRLAHTLSRYRSTTCIALLYPIYPPGWPIHHQRSDGKSSPRYGHSSQLLTRPARTGLFSIYSRLASALSKPRIRW
jgi:hypothetical protein